MSEPLGEKPGLDLNLFTTEAVERFRKDPNSIEQRYLRHYNQLVTCFDDPSINKALLKFKIPLGITTTIYGGYTGQFTEAMKRNGMRVIFTDPSEEWVNQAKSKGFEAYKVSVQEIPKELLERTDLFASFECYPDLIGESEFYYPMMRFLTTKYGILFSESKETVKSMQSQEDEETSQELGTFRRWFRPLKHVYGINRKALKTTYLNFYHLDADPNIKKELEFDCKLMKFIFDNFVQDYRFTEKDVSELSSRTKLERSLIDSSIERFASLSESINAPFIRTIPYLAKQLKGSLRIGSKRYYFIIDETKSLRF